MRYEWQYQFTSESLQFEKAVKYSINLHKEGSDPPETAQGIVEIRPDEKRQDAASTSGTVAISIPFDIERGTPIANKLANDFGQRMAFEFGDFQISWALLACERIPETDEEKEEIGDLTHHVQIRLQTVPEKKVFDPRSIDGFQLPMSNPVLLRLFNAAESKTDIVDRYLTRFKILETEFVDNASRAPTKDQLKNSHVLNKTFFSVATSQAKNRTAFEKFIDKLVDARGQCAHLKNYKYGFLPGDPRLKDLEVLEGTLRGLCKALIKASK